MNKNDTIYKIGVIVTILGAAGIADAITGQGSFFIACCVFAVGFGCVLGGYLK